jgi:AcrR family transcriptional regulator
MKEKLSTKEILSDALIKLMDEVPYNKITIGSITESCDLQRLTFYYHFKDKTELLYWTYNRIVYVSEKDFTFSNWEEMVIKCLNRIKERKVFFMNAMKHTNNEFSFYLVESSRSYFEKILPIFTDGRPVFSSDETKFIVDFVASGAIFYIQQWIMGECCEPPEDIISKFKKVALFFNIKLTGESH